MAYISLLAFPGYPAGTKLTLQPSGVYRTDDLLFWTAASVVEQDKTRFVEDKLPDFGKINDFYYYIDDTGVVQQTKLVGSDIDLTHLTIGNFFKTLEQVIPVEEQFKKSFALRKGPIAYTKDDVAAALGVVADPGGIVVTP